MASEVLAVQRRIDADVMRESGVTASAAEPSRLTRLYTEDEEASRLYLLGRHFFKAERLRDTESSMARRQVMRMN